MIKRSDQQPDPELELRMQRAIRSAQDEIAPEVAERLAAMRRNAVAEFETRGRRRLQRIWIPLSAAAAAAASIAIVAGLLLFRSNGAVPAMPAEPDAPEFTAAQELEVLADLEFLAWLDEEASDAG